MGGARYEDMSLRLSSIHLDSPHTLVEKKVETCALRVLTAGGDFEVAAGDYGVRSVGSYLNSVSQLLRVEVTMYRRSISGSLGNDTKLSLE
jgi:hypothetical protein